MCWGSWAGVHPSRGVQAVVWIRSMILVREVQSQLGFLSNHSKPVVKSLGENSHLDPSAIQTCSVAREIHLFFNSCGSVRVLVPQAGLGFAFWCQAEPNPQSHPILGQQGAAGNLARHGFVDLWICGFVGVQEHLELDKLLQVPVQEGRTGDVQRDGLKANLLALGLVYTEVNELQPIYLKLSR